MKQSAPLGRLSPPPQCGQCRQLCRSVEHSLATSHSTKITWRQNLNQTQENCDASALFREAVTVGTCKVALSIIPSCISWHITSRPAEVCTCLSDIDSPFSCSLALLSALGLQCEWRGALRSIGTYTCELNSDSAFLLSFEDLGLRIRKYRSYVTASYWDNFLTN